MHFLVKKKSVGIFNGLYLFNLYPITNWPFQLNPSPCPWPFPIDGYKKRVMFGFVSQSEYLMAMQVRQVELRHFFRSKSKSMCSSSTSTSGTGSPG